MNRYTVHVQETYDINYIVDAPDEDEAYEMVEDAINNGNLDPADGGDYDRHTEATLKTANVTETERDHVPADLTCEDEDNG